MSHENVAALREAILEDRLILMAFQYAEPDFLVSLILPSLVLPPNCP